eukprot:6191343-Pleurochrysis_carterae.AAC.1
MSPEPCASDYGEVLSTVRKEGRSPTSQLKAGPDTNFSLSIAIFCHQRHTAWQDLISYYHAPALYCRASRLDAASGRGATVARQASSGIHKRAIYSETASYSLMTARTVR